MRTCNNFRNMPEGSLRAATQTWIRASEHNRFLSATLENRIKMFVHAQVDPKIQIFE